MKSDRRDQQKQLQQHTTQQLQSQQPQQRQQYNPNQQRYTQSIYYSNDSNKNKKRKLNQEEEDVDMKESNSNNNKTLPITSNITKTDYGLMIGPELKSGQTTGTEIFDYETKEETADNMLDEIKKEMEKYKNMVNNMSDIDTGIFEKLYMIKLMENMGKKKKKDVPAPPSDIKFTGNEKLYDIIKKFRIWTSLNNICKSDYVNIWMVHILRGDVKNKILNEYDSINNNFNLLIKKLERERANTKDIDIGICV